MVCVGPCRLIAVDLSKCAAGSGVNIKTQHCHEGLRMKDARKKAGWHCKRDI